MFKNLAVKMTVLFSPLFALLGVTSAHAESAMLTGITLDTVTPLAAAAMVIAALGVLWAINKVIAIFKK